MIKPNMADDEQLVMYIVLVKDNEKKIKMDPGKAIAQAGHVIANVITELLKTNPQLWQKYIEAGKHPKIVLRANTAQMEKIIATCDCRWTHDVGKTQVPSGTLTAIAFLPMTKSQAPDLIRSLSLY